MHTEHFRPLVRDPFKMLVHVRAYMQVWPMEMAFALEARAASYKLLRARHFSCQISSQAIMLSHKLCRYKLMYATVCLVSICTSSISSIKSTLKKPCVICIKRQNYTATTRSNKRSADVSTQHVRKISFIVELSDVLILGCRYVYQYAYYFMTHIMIYNKL